jgi:hypothetical protein
VVSIGQQRDIHRWGVPRRSACRSASWCP